VPGGIEEYRRKRDFARTSEPDAVPPDVASGPLRFVVHKHAATRLHYDVRLELDGVLKSWALPKGPSALLGEKRMAAPTEDHPLPYAGFEGLIPRGQYGAGPSLIWDAGTFAPDEKGVRPFDNRELAESELRKGIAAGKVSVTFRGRKLKGSWALVRTKDDGSQWLMLKHRDAAADPAPDVTEVEASVASGLLLDDLRSGVVPTLGRQDWSFSPSTLEGAVGSAMTNIEPMLATAAAIPPRQEFIFEPKLDGVRVLAYVRDGGVELRSRNGIDVTKAYPGIAAALSRQPVSTVTFDGEIVAIDAGGRPSFELLQQRMNLQDPAQVAIAERTIPTVFFAFDVVHLDGYDLKKCALRERQEVLSRVLIPERQLQQVFAIPADAEEAYEAAVNAGFEGIIAKLPESKYEAGRRSAAWVKRKALEREIFVVGGWTPGTGHRGKSFGGLIIGEPEAGGLGYRGKVGGGFTDAEAASVRRKLEELRTESSPFAAPTPDDRHATWVRPELEIEVEFLNRTNGNVLRAPVFKRLISTVGSPPAPAARPATASAPDAAEQLRSMKAKGMLQGDGWQLAVTNLDKILWPAERGVPAHTKRDVLVYAAEIFPTMARHIADRPITLLRFPNGIHDKKFYQKHWEAELPPFVQTLEMYSDGEGGDQQFLLCNNLPTLLWLCQLADIEWHAQLARINPQPDARGLPLSFTGSSENLDASVLNYPDFILFDLDPYIYAGTEKSGDEPQPNESAFARTCDVALSLKEILDSLTLSSFVKTSGATGLHIYVPILRQLDYSVIRAAANTVCAALLARRSKDVTMEWATEKRTGKVFLDANQNARHKNLAVAYSPRAKAGAPVSMPLRWDEVGKVKAADFSIANVPALVAERGDAWARILEVKQDLQKVLGLG